MDIGVALPSRGGLRRGTARTCGNGLDQLKELRECLGE